MRLIHLLKHFNQWNIKKRKEKKNHDHSEQLTEIEYVDYFVTYK